MNYLPKQRFHEGNSKRITSFLHYICHLKLEMKTEGKTVPIRSNQLHTSLGSACVQMAPDLITVRLMMF